MTRPPSSLKWANEYLAYATKYTNKVHSEKRRVFRRFFQFVKPEATVDKIASAIALQFLQKQFQQRSDNAANKDRKNLVAAWNWGIKFLDLPKPNPFELVEKFPTEEQGHYVPPGKDFWAVFKVATGQDKVVPLTFLQTAGRRGEIYRLRWEDVDFLGQRIRLKTRKRKGGTEQEDWLPLRPQLATALKDHQATSINEWIFVPTKRPTQGEALY